MKVLKCTECVKCASESYKGEKVCVRVCFCVHTPFGLSLSECQFEEDQNTFLRFVTCVAATGRLVLVFFIVFRTSAGTSDGVCHVDCFHDNQE